VTLCVASTASLPGTIQVVARSVETAMHKLHELGFDLRTVKRGRGNAPLPPIAADDLTALGWTNDAILYGGSVNLSVDADDDTIARVIERVPSSSSGDFGTPFLDIFQSYDNDFYKIDKLLFSPAKIVIENLRSGKLFEAGEIHHDVLQKSFGCEATSAGESE
jgi:methenyltetrahydromethanopterin cyclohydrolase